MADVSWLSGSNPDLSEKFPDKGNFEDTEASVKRHDKCRSERSVFGADFLPVVRQECKSAPFKYL